MNKRIQIVALIGFAAAGAMGLAVLKSTPTDHVLAEGEFHSVAHRGQGTAKIIHRNGRRFLRIEDFRTSWRPGLDILLIAVPDALENETVKNAAKFTVGPLKPNLESLEYELPMSLDLSSYSAVTVWNSGYQVNYATAPLIRTPEEKK